MVGICNVFVRCLAIVVGAIVLMGAGGCATIMAGGGEQTVRINSTPTGAAVKIDGHEYGVTPTMAKLSRKETHLVQLQLAGYAPAETKLEKGLNGWVFGNIIFGGLFGLVVDVVSGSANELKPGEVQQTFAKVDSGGGGNELTLHVNLQRSVASQVHWIQQYLASGQRELGPPRVQE
jgi:hypothetical protein